MCRVFSAYADMFEALPHAWWKLSAETGRIESIAIAGRPAIGQKS
jgi:hypothetical protein